MINRLVAWLALTKTEQRVLLFLSVTFLLGVGIRWYKQSSFTEQTYNYQKEDSIFVARSAVPAASTQTTVETPTLHKSTEKILLNINTATQEELESLPGIGKILAERIIHYRTSTGKFQTVNDLRKVKGITPKKLQQLQPYLTVR